MTGNNFQEFVVAVQKGDMNSIRKLCRDEWINKEDENGLRPIHRACVNGYVGVVQMLLERDCQIEVADRYGRRPIHLACATGYGTIVQILLNKHCQIEVANADGLHPIHLACANGHCAVVQLLLSKGCEVEIVDKNGLRPIHTACIDGHFAVVKMLLDRSCQKEAEDLCGRRSIYFACVNGHSSIVQLLLDRGCRIESNDMDGRRPIHLACTNGHFAVVQMLLDRDCDIEATDLNGLRPLHLACANGRTDVVQMLLFRGAQIEVVDKNGLRPIHMACANGHITVVQLLLDSGCHVDVQTKNGQMPLDLIKYENSEFSRIIGNAQAERRNKEYQIFHFPTYSIVCRMYKINDFNHVRKFINGTIPVVKRTVVVCDLNGLQQHLSTSMNAVRLSSQSLQYSEYIVCDKQENGILLEDKIKRIRDWDVFPVVKGSVADLGEVKYRSSTFDWSQHYPLTLTFNGDHRPTEKGAVTLLRKQSCSCDEIKSVFIDFSNLVYAVRLSKEMQKEQVDRRIVTDLMMKQLLMRTGLLIFYDENGEKLSKKVFAENSIIAKDGRIAVVQKPIGNIQNLPMLLSLYLDMENIQNFVSSDYVLLRCITDDGLALAVLRRDCHTVEDLKQKISEFCTGGNIVLVDQKDVIQKNSAISVDDDVLYYAAVLPYDGITKTGKLGRGSFGAVFKCKMENSSNEFAMKKIKCEQADYNQTRADIKREILVAARIGSHGNIMRYHAFYGSKSAFYILMDLMMESLTHHLRSLRNAFIIMVQGQNEHPLGEPKILLFAKQILEGLKYLHDHKIIHRDLKGSNVLMSDDTCLKLTDFGLCKCLTDKTDKISAEGGNTIAGTYRYMAPEIFAGEPTKDIKYDLKVDIWSFGATMVEIITGSPPYPDWEDAAAVYRIGIKRTIEYECPAVLSQDLKRFVDKCLHPYPSDRPNCAKLLSHPLFRELN